MNQKLFYLASSAVVVVFASFLGSFVGPLTKIISSSLGFAELVGTLDAIQSLAYLVGASIFSIIVFRSVYGFPLVFSSSILLLVAILAINREGGSIVFLSLAGFYLVFSLFLSPILAILPLLYRDLGRKLWHGLTIGNILSYSFAGAAYVASGYVFRYFSYWGLVLAVSFTIPLLFSLLSWEKASRGQEEDVREAVRRKYVLKGALEIHTLAVKIIAPYLLLSTTYSMLRPYLLIIPAELGFGSYEATASVIGLSSLVATVFITPVASRFADLYVFRSFIAYVSGFVLALVVLCLSIRWASFSLYSIGLVVLIIVSLLVSIIYQVVPLRVCRDDRACSSRVFNALTLYGRLVSGVILPMLSSYILSVLGFSFISSLAFWVTSIVVILSLPSIYLFRRIVGIVG